MVKYILLCAIASGALIFAGVQTNRLAGCEQQNKELKGWIGQAEKLQELQKLTDEEKEQQARENGCNTACLQMIDVLNHWTYPPECQYTTQPLKDYIGKLQSEGYCKTHTRDDAFLLLEPMMHKVNHEDFSQCDLRITNAKKHHP